MPSEPESLRARSKAFAIRIIHLFRALPNSPDAHIIGKQVLRSGTSVGANYRSACRARSRQEFAARIGIVLEEADETVFWLELLDETGAVRHERMTDLLAEAKELTAIFTTAQRTARQKK
jgi:four helix bundle protein